MTHNIEERLIILYDIYKNSKKKSKLVMLCECFDCCLWYRWVRRCRSLYIYQSGGSSSTQAGGPDASHSRLPQTETTKNGQLFPEVYTMMYC